MEEVKHVIGSAGVRVETTAPGCYSVDEEISARSGFYRVLRSTATTDVDLPNLSDAHLGGKGSSAASIIAQFLIDVCCCSDPAS